MWFLLKVQDKWVPEPSFSFQAPRGESGNEIWGTLVTIYTFFATFWPRFWYFHVLGKQIGMLYNQTVASTRYVGWSVCHEEVAEEIFKLIEVIILLHSLTSLFQIWFQRPTFLHPESTPPKKPWIFIGFAFFCWQFQPSITGTPGPGAHYHVDNVDLPSWQVNLILKNVVLGNRDNLDNTKVQLRGVKTWRLRSPPECWMSCHGEIKTTLYPGDIIIVNTNIWFHSTKVEEELLFL